MSWESLHLAYRFATKRHAAKILLLVAWLVCLMLSGIVQTRADGTPIPASKVLIQITAATIVIRSGPSESYQALETVKQGGKIQVSGISTDGGWFMLKYGAGQGWITSDPQSSIFVSGNASLLPIIDFQYAGGSSTTTTDTAPLQRASLQPLAVSTPCGSDTVFLNLVIDFAHKMSTMPDKGNLEDVQTIETTRAGFLKASSITNCKLNSTGQSIAYFQLGAYAESLINVNLILALYQNQQMLDRATYHYALVTHSGTQSIDNIRALQLVIKDGSPLSCISAPLTTVAHAINFDVFSMLDSIYDDAMSINDNEGALRLLEAIWAIWSTDSKPKDCSAKVEQLSFLTTNVIDETIVATLYLKQGDIAMYNSHIKAATNSIQLVNGLLKSQ